MVSRPRRSISVPIVLSSIAVALSAAILVGWIYLILENLALTKQVVQNTWLMVAGIVSLVAIMAVLVLFSWFLAREILEVRRQTSFVDSVTHELRSPLASLRLCLETLGRSDLPAGQHETLREMMLGDVERLSGFIDDILEASRLGQGKEPHELQEVSLHGIVQHSLDAVLRRHRAEDVRVMIDIPPGLSIRSDAMALQIVIKNLLDNAIKYSDPPASVEVHSQARNGKLRLSVRDHGIGIAKRDLKRVFERFYRVPEERARARHGTGLGLFVAAAIVRNLGGTLRAFSEGPGHGTEMEVILPLEHKPSRRARRTA